MGPAGAEAEKEGFNRVWKTSWSLLEQRLERRRKMHQLEEVTSTSCEDRSRSEEEEVEEEEVASTDLDTDSDSQQGQCVCVFGGV